MKRGRITKKWQERGKIAVDSSLQTQIDVRLDGMWVMSVGDFLSMEKLVPHQSASNVLGPSTVKL